MDKEALKGALKLELSDAQFNAFEEFESRLYEANETKNLTRIPREQAWIKHFLDSLLFEDLIPAGSTVLDLGTGPGLPAWPLAQARPDLQVVALDSNGKMLDFLRSMPLQNLEVVQARAEEFDRREAFDVVTGRALAPLPAQLELSAAFARIGGLIIPMRTASDEPDNRYRVLGIDLIRTVARSLPEGAGDRLFPVYEKRAPTPARHPRRWAEIKTKPL